MSQDWLAATKDFSAIAPPTSIDPTVRAVAAGLARFPGIPVICDPVIAASGGDRLADDPTIAAMRDALFARCTLLIDGVRRSCTPFCVHACTSDSQS